MADAITPSAAAASGIPVAVAAVYMGFDAEILAWALGGVVVSQAFMPQPKDRSLWSIGLLAGASMMVAAVLTPFFGPLGHYLVVSSLKPFAPDLAALFSSFPMDLYRRGAAAICGAMAQPLFLLGVLFARKKLPIPEESKSG